VKKTVLILGARAPIALELCRSFSVLGYRVVCGDPYRFPAARFSTHCDKYYRIPSPVFNFKRFRKRIIEIIEKEKVVHVIPTSEEAFHLSMIKRELPCKTWVSKIGLMDELHNKLSFINIAKDFFATPKTIVLSEFSDFDNEEKYVFKAIYSRFGHSVFFGDKNQQKASSIEEQQKWIAQEKIFGFPVCTYSIFDNGTLKTLVNYKPEFLYKGGASMLFENYHNEQIYNNVKKFGKSISYTGQLSFDFIISDNVPFVIECNPRGTSGAHLLDKHLADCFMSDYEIGNDIVNKNKAIKLAILIEYPFAFLDKKYRESKDVIFKYNDPMPLFGQFLSIAEMFYLKYSKGISLADVMTYDIEFNGLSAQ
jgi:predicted ATP-grasp superfamily ATP-dependent carboligase